MSIQRFITGIQNLTKNIVLIHNFPSYFPKHLPASLVLSQVNNTGSCLHYCSHLNFPKVIPHWGISKNKIKKGFFKKIITLFLETLLSSSSNVHCEEPRRWRGSQGCSSTLSCKTVLQMVWPGRSSFPGKIAGQQLPRGRAMCLQDDTVGMTRMTMSQLKARRRAFAVTACRGGKSWLFWERQIRASPTHSNLPCQTPGLDSSGAIGHPQGPHQRFPSQQSWQISEDQCRKSGLNP